MSKSKPFELGIFIFRRDLRLDDNLGLIELLGKCESILPVFFLDKNQINETPKNKNYHSVHAVQFMCESLQDLNSQLEKNQSRLRLFYGLPWENLNMILGELKPGYKSIAVGWNHDYSEYSKYRDGEMRKVCEKVKVSTVVNEHEYTLRPMDEYAKGDGSGFKQFSAFWRTASAIKPNAPIANSAKHYLQAKIHIKGEFEEKLGQFYTENVNLAQRGGRKIAVEKLQSIGKFTDYSEKRDFLAYSPTNLSAALNFGCISVREAYHSVWGSLGGASDLIKQFYWRDYFLAMAHFLPHGTSYKRMIDNRFDKIEYTPNHEEWDKLWNAKTGFLIIDAAITQMKEVGYCPNRARMVVGMMWSKYMLTHVYDEKYGLQAGFSKLLVDAVGPTQNKLNCAWVVELDFAGRRYAAPGAPLSGRPMDVSNKQIKKWDPECTYIKKWLPHLKNVPKDALFVWDDEVAKRYKNIHPAPMFDAKKRFDEWIERCRKVE